MWEFNFYFHGSVRTHSRGSGKYICQTVGNAGGTVPKKL